MAIVTAHPFDMSALRTQLAIKKMDDRLSPVFRIALEPDEKAQRLAMQRGKMIVVAMGMKERGLPMREFDPYRDNFPCNYCSWKSRCIADGDAFGLMLPLLPWPTRRHP
jgi:hypothetical protein